MTNMSEPKEIERLAFICVHCEAVYADAPVTQCDCMLGSRHDFIEGVIKYILPHKDHDNH